MITAQMVKNLREKTGAGMMDCKKALGEADGNEEKAVEILREKGLAAAAKKAGRIAAEGLIETYISEDKKVGSLVEVNCETDFVAQNDLFKTFVKDVAKHAAASKATDLETLLEEKFIANETLTLKEALTEEIAKIGENMNVRRFVKYNAEDGLVNSYIHGGGKLGVMVQVQCSVVNDVVSELARDLAMQVAAANPTYVSRDQVDTESLDKEREIYRVQALNEGKPEKIVDKMVEGRIQKYYKEVCLVEQLWVKNGDLTIKKLLEEKSKEVGSPITVKQFVRLERGEGLEKKVENFEEEINKQLEQFK